MSSTLRQSDRLAAVQTPVIPIIARWMAETPGTISLGQGLVAYGPPAEAIAAMRRFPSRAEDHRYGPVEGQPALVEAIEAKLAGENGIRVAPDSRVFVTAGSNLAFANAVLAVADPGDELILPVPYYFNHEMAVVMAGCRAVSVPTGPDYGLDPDAIERAITPRTRAVVTISPNNPTGAVYPRAILEAVNAICARHGVFHIHDEAYEYFTYDGAEHVSPGAFPNAAAHTISLFSLSKSYGFASWRVGYMVVPTALADAINKIQDTLLICAPVVSQEAALAAMRVGGAYPRARLEELDRRRRVVREILGAADVPCVVPDATGALYHFIRVPDGGDSLALTEHLIRRHRVAVIPGSAFGASDACFLRVSYGAVDDETLREGVMRLAEGIRTRMP